jgi:TerC family integral membrane protein
MLDVTTTAWAVTVGLVLVLLAIDLALAVARPHEVGFREAAITSIFYIAVAIAFGVVFGLNAGWDFGGQYFAGYIVEKSLSVDNLFVFVVIMTSFAVPREHQQKVLIVGIVLALVLRVIFIALGAALLSAFSFMFLVFGVLLVGTAIQLFRHRDQDPSVEGQHARELRQATAARHRRVRRRQAHHAAGREAHDHAALSRARGHWQHGHPLRDGLDPRRVRSWSPTYTGSPATWPPVT